MLWLLFPLLAVIALSIILYLPVGAVLGYLVVLGWISFLLYLVFYRGDPVSQAMRILNGSRKTTPVRRPSQKKRARTPRGGPRR